MGVRQVWVWIACGCAALVFLCGCENKLSALKRAARLAKLQRHAEAIAAYEHYIELVGDGPGTTYERAEAWYQIGLIRTYRLNEPDKAIEALERATTLRPDYADPLLQLGYLYNESATGASPERVAELRTKTADVLRAALAQRPEVTDYELAPGTWYSPRLSLSYAERERGHLNEAIRQLYIFEHYSDDDARDWAEIGNFFLRHGEHAKALFYFKRAFDALDENQRGQPKGMDVRNALIEACIQNGYLERAGELLDESRSVLEQYRSQYRSLPERARSETADLGEAIDRWHRDLLALLERIYENSGQYEEALGAVRELHALEPEAGRLLLSEAQLSARMGNYAGARELLRQYRHLAPLDASAILTEAFILYQEKDYRAYIERIEAYLVLVPEKARPRGMRALAQVKAGLVDEGIAQLEDYCRAEPNFPRLQLTMARALSVAGETKRAIWWLRRLMDCDIVAPHNLTSDPDLANVRQDPEFPELLREARYRMNLLQDVHEAEDRLYRGYATQGLSALQRLREQNPDIPYTTYALARADVFAGDNDDAFALLIQCAKAGFFSPTRLQADIYLTELRSDPRFKEVLDSIEQPWPSTTSE
jgi:tetratricopeptide (TPR) repeat protein